MRLIAIAQVLVRAAALSGIAAFRKESVVILVIDSAQRPKEN